MRNRNGLVASSIFALLASTVTLAGCAADAGTGAGAPSERTAQASEAQIKSKSVDIGTDAIAIGAAYYDIAHASVSVTEGSGTFTPSAPMAKTLGSAAPITFSVPPVHVSNPWYEPDFDVAITQLDQLGTPRVEVNDTHLDLFVSAAGRFHVDAGVVHPDYVVEQADVNARFVVGAGGALSIDVVNVNMTGHVVNCGAFGWCSGIASAVVGDVSGKVGDAVKSALTTELGKPATQNAWFQFLDTWANLWSDGPAWHTDRSTIAIAGDFLHYEATRHELPDPPVCSYSVGCNDQVTMHCSGSWALASVNAPDGSLLPMTSGWDYTTGSMKFVWGGTILSSPSQVAHACTWDADGSSCIDITVPLPHNACYIPIPRIPRPVFR